MTLATGTKLGPYEVLAPIGAGGMGEVYRRLHLLGDLPSGHRVAARPDADSTATLVSELRSGSRGAAPVKKVYRSVNLREPWSRRERS